MRTDKQAARAFKVLTEDEAETLELIADQIFPRTDTPGAVEIGAVNYIDVALSGDYALLMPLYRRGIRAIDRYARTKFGRTFRSLGDELREAVLLALEGGAIAEFKDAAEFFATVRCHVLEGVFCEPQYGGNKDMIGWRLVNFPGQQSGYPDAYVNKRVDLEPVAHASSNIEGKKS